MKILRASLLPLLTLIAVACGSDGGSFVPVEFAPTQAELPFPTDFVFVGSADGTLNIPVADPDDLTDPINGLNELDGFSTVAPIVISLKDNSASTRDVDESSIRPGQNVRLLEMIIDPTLGVPVAVAGEVSAADYTVIARGRTIVVVPLRPLKPKTSYLVLVSRGLRTTEGVPVGRSRDYALALRLSPIIDGSGRSRVDGVSDADAQLIEQFRALTILHVQRASQATGVATEDVVLTTTFLTQSIGDVLAEARDQAIARPLAVGPTGTDTGDLGLGLPGIADIYAGQLQIPNYLDSSAPLTSSWRGLGGGPVTRYNPAPVMVETLNIPVIMTVPNAGSGQTKPDDGWPVVIYQHAITRMRTDIVAVADAFAAAGFVTIAIDMPLHGITDTAHPLYQAGFERTFDLDLVNNTTLAPVPDGEIDPSSTHFINLRSLLTARDNQRQATADLFTLVRSLASVDFDGIEGADLDTDAVHVFAHSFGAMICTPFLALDGDRVASAVLAMPGGGVARLFEASPSFSSLLIGGLAAAGIFQGTPEFDQFMTALQTIVDSADPVNYIAAAAQATPIFMMELVGKAPNNPSDQTVPNFVPTAPLSGTEPLARLAGLVPVTGDLANAGGLRAIVRYTANGTHSSYLEPAQNVTLAPEMLGSALSFFLSDGTIIDVLDTTTIE